MPCDCKALEVKYGDSGCKCVHYREHFPECECERSSVSAHSPGLVQDDEILIRTLYSPFQINEETGRVDPAHFRTDLEKRGFSVNRMDHISETDLQTKIARKIEHDRAKGRQRGEFYRVVTARCGDIRHLVDGDRRLFCTYDTASEDDPSHADVCQALEYPPGTQNRRALAKENSAKLYDQFFGEVMDLQSLYSSSSNGSRRG